MNTAQDFIALITAVRDMLELDVRLTRIESKLDLLLETQQTKIDDLLAKLQANNARLEALQK